MENKCPGCGRNEIHKSCPAHGTKYYMSGKKFTYFQEQRQYIIMFIKAAIISMMVCLLDILLFSHLISYIPIPPVRYTVAFLTGFLTTYFALDFFRKFILRD